MNWVLITAFPLELDFTENGMLGEGIKWRSNGGQRHLRRRGARRSWSGSPAWPSWPPPSPAGWERGSATTNLTVFKNSAT